MALLGMEAALGTEGWLATSLASMHQMLIAASYFPSSDNQKLSPDVVKCPLGEILLPIENQCTKPMSKC